MEEKAPPKKRVKIKPRKRKHAEIESSEDAQIPTILDSQNDISLQHEEGNDHNEDNHNDAGNPKRTKSRKSKPRKLNWNVSQPMGGMLSDLLPIFSADEEHLLLGYSHSVKVYSTATSMLVRACQIGSTELSSFCLSNRSPTQLYVLLRDGKIQLWDWTTAKKLKTWDLGGQVSDIAVSTLSAASDLTDTVFVAESRKGGSEITAHRLDANEERAAKSLYREKQSIKALRTLDHGRHIIAITVNSIIVGTRVKSTTNKLKQLHYTFNTFSTPETITSFDARNRSIVESKESNHNLLDVAVGLDDGSIRIYYDAAKVSEGGSKQLRTIPRNEKLHWHRQAVRSIAWTSDGNYLLSGGSETVLVLWQLDTKAKTMLPHLMSSIEAITVSSKGSSYAVRLADNSAMILATTDFVPTFNVAGLGIPSTKPYEDKSITSELPHRRTPVTCSLSQPPRILSAVPSDPYGRKVRSERYLGFSANTSLSSIPLSSTTSSVSRQTLVDSHATDLRIAPTGKPVNTSNVVLLEVSQDGEWMATVDEWFQPLDDILSTCVDEHAAKMQQLRSVETTLAFWSWNDEKDVWDRSTRISQPHSDELFSLDETSLVLDLVTEFRQAVFWTLGSDGRVKQWRARDKEVVGTRETSSKRVTGTVWRCTKSIAVPYSSDTNINGVRAVSSARLSISSDNSLFAVSRAHSSASTIILFAMQSDGIAQSLLNFNLEYPGVSAALLNQYLVLADCESVLVRDLTDSTKWYKANYNSTMISSDLMIPPQIAVDHEHQVFAISVPQKLKSEASTKSRKSRITIFSPSSNNSLATLDNQPLSAALLCVPQHRKFHVLTTEAEIYTISPDLMENTEVVSVEGTVDMVVEPDSVQPSNILSNIFGDAAASTLLTMEETIMPESTMNTKIAWEDIPGLNLEQPFTLPKMSAIQAMMSVSALKA